MVWIAITGPWNWQREGVNNMYIQLLHLFPCFFLSQNCGLWRRSRKIYQPKLLISKQWTYFIIKMIVAVFFNYSQSHVYVISRLSFLLLSFYFFFCIFLFANLAFINFPALFNKGISSSHSNVWKPNFHEDFMFINQWKNVH